ncbi:MAG: MFS transporter [Verrucomicrobia bacterium]|jgi:MFS family permease|nr:MFS transporter [Verrucomicrobiota bacterium]OQC67852.1 MAG: putative niacin/nicotinamide transporter NaiP [Verrucomicrobia bacterium ADurb.Bin006]MDI9382139.1 MFS transporter [Verrucomicrobiota bacterium]NMD20504.1 MFS transporter [Verrucomicrobiota bacterium]HNU98787.1 MFS transporter [Verrucomicrobiota bacterium]
MQAAPARSGGFTRGQWMVLIAAFLGWMFDGVEMGIFPVVARPALQEILGTEADQAVGPWMGYITALFLVGAAGGGLVFGWLGDKVGRVRAMTASILAYSLFTGACYFAQAAWQLGLLRFLAALGMGGEWSLGVALVMECWPEAKRPLMAGIIGAAANVGYALVGVVTWLIPVRPDSWRWVMLAGAIPALLAFFLVLVVPESQRWKASVQRARAEPLRIVFGAGLWRTTLLAIAFGAIALIGTWGSVQWLPLWGDQLVGKSFPQVKGVIMLALSAGAILGCFIGPWIGAVLGRRMAYFTLCACSLLSCAVLFRIVDSFGPAFVVGSFVVGAATAAFYGWLPLYLPELFPTRARATGQGISFNAGRILAAGGALTQGQLVSHYGGSYAQAGAVVTLIYVVGMVLIWFGPETKGKPLPE